MDSNRSEGAVGFSPLNEHVTIYRALAPEEHFSALYQDMAGRSGLQP